MCSALSSTCGIAGGTFLKVRRADPAPGVAVLGAEAHRILVADDEPSVREQLQKALTNAGHSVDLCEDGEEALQTLLSHSYTLVILDVLMPHRTGVEIAKTIRARGDGVPIIFMTGALHERIRKSCSDLKRVGWISKPISPSQIETAIGMVMGGPV